MRRRLDIHLLLRKSPHKTSMIIAAFLALVVPLALSGPVAAGNSGGAPGPQTWTVLAGSESAHQAIQGMAFLPTDVFVDAGDAISWHANSAEPHTITFLPPGAPLMAFNPGDPTQLFPVGTSSYDGTSYYNSGILSNVTNSGLPAVTSYSLVFPAAGDFTYYCLLHGEMMKGTVHVSAAGTAYPYTQKDYNNQAKKQAKDILRDGRALWHETAKLADPHHVYAGADDGTAMVMRFIQPSVRVHVGQTVTFINNGMGAPHTVTFGQEPANAFVPSGDPRTFAGGDLNSGIMEPGSSFTVTFTTPGTFSYICALHDYMGMMGTVVVK